MPEDLSGASPAISPPVTSKLAIASLVTGILATFCSFLAGVPAIVMGAMALSRIGGSHGKLAGRGLAIAGICTGLVCSIIGTATLAGLAAPLVIRQRERADQAAMRGEMRKFHREAMAYLEQKNAFPAVSDAEALLAEIQVRQTLKGQWLYFPKAPPTGPQVPLLISPGRREHLLLRTDGSVITIKSPEELRGIIEAGGSSPVAIPPTYQ